MVTKTEEPGGERQYQSTWLTYATNGQAVTFVVGEEWDTYGGLPSDAEHDIIFAREFWYDGARQRYCDRELDVVYLELYELVEDKVGGDSHWSALQ